MIGQICNQPDTENRLAGSLAIAAKGFYEGIDIIRVHDVREHVDLFSTREIGGVKVFLIFGSDSLAIRLAEWIGARSRVRIIGLAEQLVPMKDVEIVALPTEMELHEMPLPEVTPTAVMLLEEIICDDDPVQELKNRWPNTPILSTIDVEGAEMISVEDLTTSAIQDRLRSIDRKQGASEVLRRLSDEEDSKILIVCHDNPDPDSLARPCNEAPL